MRTLILVLGCSRLAYRVCLITYGPRPRHSVQPQTEHTLYMQTDGGCLTCLQHMPDLAGVALFISEGLAVLQQE